jgi:hypothetical protein
MGAVQDKQTLPTSALARTSCIYTKSKALPPLASTTIRGPRRRRRACLSSKRQISEQPFQKRLLVLRGLSKERKNQQSTPIIYDRKRTTYLHLPSSSVRMRTMSMPWLRCRNDRWGRRNHPSIIWVPGSSGIIIPLSFWGTVKATRRDDRRWWRWRGLWGQPWRSSTAVIGRQR